MMKNFLKKIKNKLPDNHWIRFLYSKFKSYFAYLSNLQKVKNFQDKIKIIGITGTDGKTTTSIFTAQLFELLGNKVGLISSQELRDGQTKQKNFTKRTTPGASFVYNFINKCISNGCKYVIVEVSAHAITQGRVFGIKFDAGAFTNLSQEHGDYYPTIKQYGQTKLQIFDMVKKNGLSIINTNTLQKYDFIQNYFQKNKDKIQKQFFTTTKNKPDNIQSPQTANKFGTGNLKSDILFANIKDLLSDKTVFELQYQDKKEIVEFFVPGKYNVENLSVAFLFAIYFGFDFNKITKQIPNIKPVSGRLQKIEIDQKYDFDVFVDFAVTPQALQSVLEYAKSIARGNVWIVFGATGGNHDHSKRPLMGKVASKLADKVILTEDESYGEDVQKIWEDVFDAKLNIKNKEKTSDFVFLQFDEKITCISSRLEAIKYALANIGNGDILVITGMGDLQSRNNGQEEISWSDIEVVKKILK